MSQTHSDDGSVKINDATFLLQTPAIGLPLSQVMGSLATGYRKNTTTTGVQSVQAIPIPIADGGTNQTSYSTDGTIYFDGTRFVPTAVGSTTTVLHGDLTYSAVSLTADVSGILPVDNGGTEIGTLTANGVLFGNTTSAVGITAEGATGTVLHGNTGSAPTFSAVSLTADVTGVLPIANGGTNQSIAFTAGSVVFSDGTRLTQDNASLFFKSTATQALLLGGTTVATADTPLSVDGTTVFNEQSGTVDFRVEGDTATNLFVSRGANDDINIGTTVVGEIAQFTSTAIRFNESGLSTLDFRVEGDTQDHLLFVDASADFVGISNATPHSTLHVDGSFAVAKATVTISYNMTNADCVILANAEPSVAGITITLPSGAVGTIVSIVKTNPNIAKTVSVTPAGVGFTIDGSTSPVIMGTQYSYITMMYIFGGVGQTNWKIIDQG